jgi:hypothetical protein
MISRILQSGPGRQADSTGEAGPGGVPARPLASWPQGSPQGEERRSPALRRNVNPAVVLAVTRVTAEKCRLHVVTGGHTNEIARSGAAGSFACANRPRWKRTQSPTRWLFVRVGTPSLLDERLGAGSLGSGSAEAPGGRPDEGRLLLSLAPPLVRTALRLSDRPVRGLRGRRPFARDARSRPWTRQRHGSHHWPGRPNWRYRLECDQTAAQTVSDPVYSARRLALQMRRRKSPLSTRPWRIIVSFS